MYPNPTSSKTLHQINILNHPIISFSILFLFLIFLVKKILNPTKKNTKNLPPSPPKLPIIGNLHQLGTLPHRSISSLSQKHGPLLLLKLGQIQILTISSPKLAKKILKSQDLIFSNRAQNMAAKYLLYECHDVAFASYGEYWRQARKVCVLELLSAKKVESFQHVRDEEVGVLVNRIKNYNKNAHQIVNLNELLMTISNNIASRCLLGEKFEDENGKSRFGDVSRKVAVLLSRFCVGDVFPWLWWVDVLRGFYGELKSTFEALDLLFGKVIDEHKMKKMMRGGGDIIDDGEDFVDVLLRLEQDDKFDYRFTMDDFKAILLDMFVGGTDTTATGLEWTMTELMKNQTIMKKVQEEVRKIVGIKKSKIEVEDIQKMEYMQCVIKESLRLHPPVTILLPRKTTSEKVNFEGYEIPPETTVLINVWAIQRDPEVWERPNKFIPERFMEKNSADYKGQDFEFIPFGSGRRKCIGMAFGIAGFEIVLANLLYWFDWKLPADQEEELDMSEEFGVTVFKKLPLKLIPIPHLP